MGQALMTVIGIEVAALLRCMELCHLELELGGCNNDMVASQSDHYTEVPLYLNSCQPIVKIIVYLYTSIQFMLWPMVN